MLTALWRYTIRETLRFEIIWNVDNVPIIPGQFVALKESKPLSSPPTSVTLSGQLSWGNTYGISVFTKILGSDSPTTLNFEIRFKRLDQLQSTAFGRGIRHEEIDETRGTAARQTKWTPSSSSKLKLIVLVHDPQSFKGSFCSKGT